MSPTAQGVKSLLGAVMDANASCWDTVGDRDTLRKAMVLRSERILSDYMYCVYVHAYVCMSVALSRYCICIHDQ